VATDYPDLEIILADNGSTDGSGDWVQTHYPEIIVVQHPENWLFCKGNNAALPYATGKYVVLLNNDVETPPGWLKPLVAMAESDSRIAGIQPKILQYNLRDCFEYAGAAGGFLDRLGYPLARGRIFDHTEKDEGQYDNSCNLDWGSGAALLLRHSLLSPDNFLDEHFEMHMEEIDLCWRLRRQGYRIVSCPQSQVFHIGGGSLPHKSTKKLYYNVRNNLLMLYKNLSPTHWRRIFPQRILFDGGAILRLLFSGNLVGAMAFLRAYRDAHQMRSHYTHNRASENVLPTYRGSIVIDRYVFRRTTFAQLPVHQFLSINNASSEQD